MIIIRKKISELAYDPRNARKHNAKNLAAIKESLSRFGQQKPIVIDSSNIIRCGNGTVRAAKSLKWKEIDCVVSDLPDKDIVAFAITDNQTAALAEWDEEVLQRVLMELDDDLKKALQLQQEVEQLVSESSQNEIEVSYGVMVTCQTEQEQIAVLDELTKRGMKCKAIFM